MTETENDGADELARRLRDALEEASPLAFVGDYRACRETTLDGSFDLKAVAIRLLQLSVHCRGFNRTTRVNLVALSRRLGIDHSCLEPDLRPLFFCAECRREGRPDNQFDFIHHACAVPHSILALHGKARASWLVSGDSPSP